MSRYTRTFAMLATALVASACSTDKVTGPVDPPPQVILDSTVVVGLKEMVSTKLQQLDVVEFYSNRTTKVVPRGEVAWTSSSSSLYLTDGGSGLVHAVALGGGQIVASFKGTSRSINISVIGTVRWADLPSISAEAKAWIQAYVLNSNGKLFRHPDGQKKVFVGAGFDTSDVRPALDLWSVGVGGKLAFSFVSDSASSDIFLTTDMANSPAHSCGWGGAFRAGSDDIKQGVVRMCSGVTRDRILIAHEIGHALMFMGHTTGPGVLGTEETSLILGVLMSEMAPFVYAMPLGAIPY